MALFIDTANVCEIKEIAKWGIISGVTTNPKILAKESGIILKDRILEICDIIDGPISVELINEEPGDMIKEAIEYHRWHKNIVIKVPVTALGLKVIDTLERKVPIITSGLDNTVKTIEKTEKIPVNATIIMSSSQALLAALAGATYVSIFLGRTNDIIDEAKKDLEKYNLAESEFNLIESNARISVIEETSELIKKQNLKSKIIVGSIRKSIEITQSLIAGADIVTVPYKFFKKMVENPKTEETIKEFNSNKDAYNKY